MDVNKGMSAVSGKHYSCMPIQAAAAEVEQRFPNGIDVLINNAGITGPLGAARNEWVPSTCSQSCGTGMHVYSLTLHLNVPGRPML